jgi:hypothetical protein
LTFGRKWMKRWKIQRRGPVFWTESQEKMFEVKNTSLPTSYQVDASVEKGKKKPSVSVCVCVCMCVCIYIYLVQIYK